MTPWEIDDQGRVFHRPDALTKYVIAQMESGLEKYENLILAAPDLLESGKEAEWFLAHYADYIATVPVDEIERHPYLPDLQEKLEMLRAAIAKAKAPPVPDRMTSLPQPFQGERFLPPDEQHIYDDTVHSLRMRGWSRMDAEDAAIKRILDRRDATQLKGQPDG